MAYDLTPVDEIEQLDAGIRYAVEVLLAHGIETFESCEGGDGHCYAQPTVRFHGDRSEGLRGLAVAERARLGVDELRRVWSVIDGEPTGPWWELTFRRPPRVENAIEGVEILP